MLKESDIHIDTSIDKLLELWVKYSYEMLKDREKGLESSQDRKHVNTILTKKRIENISILHMNHESYTLRYLHQGSNRTKVVPIIIVA